MPTPFVSTGSVGVLRGERRLARRGRRGNVGSQPLDRAPRRVGQRNRLEISLSIFLRDVGRVFEILGIKHFVAGAITSLPARRGARPDEAVQIGGGNDVPVEGIKAARVQDPPQRLRQYTQATDDGPGTAEDPLNEANDRLRRVGEVAVTDGFAIEIAQAQIPGEMTGGKIAPETRGAGQRRHNAEIDRHRHRRILGDDAYLFFHRRSGLEPRIEEVTVTYADALGFGEGDVVDDVVPA